MVRMNRRRFFSSLSFALLVPSAIPASDHTSSASGTAHALSRSRSTALSARVPLALAGAFDAVYHVGALRHAHRLEVVERGPFAYVVHGDLVLGCLSPRWRARYQSLADRQLSPALHLESTGRTADGRLELVARLTAGLPAPPRPSGAH